MTTQPKPNQFVIVACIICGRTQAQPFLNIRESYPVSIISVMPIIPGIRNKPSSTTIEGYLCKDHYEQMHGEEEQTGQ